MQAFTNLLSLRRWFTQGKLSICIANTGCELILTRGMRLLYLPPYSPDFNPIEEAFSAIKSWIRANREYTRGELSGEITCDPYWMIWEAVFTTVTPEKVKGWFHDCGYLS